LSRRLRPISHECEGAPKDAPRASALPSALILHFNDSWTAIPATNLVVVADAASLASGLYPGSPVSPSPEPAGTSLNAGGVALA